MSETTPDLPEPAKPVERQVDADNPSDSLPGQRAALRRGALREEHAEPQGDENRDPPSAPTPPD